MVMEFLQNFVVRAADLQARYKWTTGDVCLWDQVSAVSSLRPLIGSVRGYFLSDAAVARAYARRDGECTRGRPTSLLPHYTVR